MDVGCYVNASKSVELVSLPLCGGGMLHFGRHLGMYVKGYHATRITRLPLSIKIVWLLKKFARDL